MRILSSFNHINQLDYVPIKERFNIKEAYWSTNGNDKLAVHDEPA